MRYFKHSFLLIFILLFALFLRLHSLDEREYSTDEKWTIRWAHEISTGEFYQKLYQYTFPPTYFYFIAFFLNISNDSVYVVRLFLVALSILSIYLTYLLGRRMFSERVALLSSFLLSISLFHIAFSSHMKPYGFLMVPFVLSTYLFYRYLTTHNTTLLYPMALLYVFSFYTHVYSAFFIAGHFVAALILLFRKHTFRFKPYLYTLVITGLICALWLPVLYQQRTYIETNLGGFKTLELLTFSNAHHLAYPFYKFALMIDVSDIFAYFRLFFVLFPLLSVIFLLGCYSVWKYHERAAILLFSSLFVPVVLLGFLGFFTPLYSFRYFAFLYPAYILLLSHGFFTVRSRFLRICLLVLTVGIWLVTLHHYYSIFTQPHWNVDIGL